MLEALFTAISNAEAPITHVIRNAVRGNRTPGGAPCILGVTANQVSGPQTKKANKASMPVSIKAAVRGQMENRIARPQAICPNPVRYARPVRKGSHGGRERP